MPVIRSIIIWHETFRNFRSVKNAFMVLSSEGIAIGFVAGVTYGIISLIFSFGLAKEL